MNDGESTCMSLVQCRPMFEQEQDVYFARN